MQIAACQSSPSYIYLARHAYGDRLHIGIEQVNLHVIERLAKRAVGWQQQVLFLQVALRYMDGGFCNTVHIEQGRTMLSPALKPGMQAANIDGFSTQNHQTQGSGSSGCLYIGIEQ